MYKIILPPTWLRFVLTSILLMGIFFRFANISLTVYSIEETATSLRLSGYLEKDVRAEVFTGEIINSTDLGKYQSLNPEKNLSNTIEGLIVEEPQLSPLYYVIARFWTQRFGDSPKIVRTLSAVISLLAFPALYWLCWELFHLPLTGWIAMALMAVSPFFVLYAREARLYSLWIVTILLVNSILLRAIRLNNKLWWILYAFALCIGFYTTPLSFLVAIGHGVYIIGTQGIKFKKVSIAYLLASLGALIFFSPWLYLIVQNFSASQGSTEWTSLRKIPLFSLLGSFVINIIYTFFDVPSSLLWKHLSNDYNWIDLIVGLISVTILLLVCYAFLFLVQKASKKIWLFCWSLFGVTSLIFLLPDLLFGGIRSVIPRFQIPLYISIQLAVAYLLSHKIIYVIKSSKKQSLWRLVTIGIMSCGIISCAFISQSDIWWNKYFNTDNLPMSKIINHARAPLVISDSGASHYLNILSLNYLLEPKVKFLLLSSEDSEDNYLNLPTIPSNFSEIFLLNPSLKLKEMIELRGGYQLDILYDGSKENPWHSDLSLWKLNTKESKK